MSRAFFIANIWWIKSFVGNIRIKFAEWVAFGWHPSLGKSVGLRKHCYRSIWSSPFAATSCMLGSRCVYIKWPLGCLDRSLLENPL